MDGFFIRFYLHEDQKCHGKLAWEWLLAQANKMNIFGGEAFRSIGGFGHHHQLTESTFFELGGKMAVKVEFLVTQSEIDALLNLLKREKIQAFYTVNPTMIGTVNSSAEDLL